MNRYQRELHLLPSALAQARAEQAISAVVIGGGIAGVAAAAVLGERGVAVTLFEREPVLGGRAGGFAHTLPSGEKVEMERGFHAFFRQYYNLHALLRRIDPQLSLLQPLTDYPILGPGGRVQAFEGLPTITPLQVIALSLKSPHLRLRDLVHTNAGAALEMMRYESTRTYDRFDGVSAAAYLDSLNFPPMARRMLFDVFAHSSFNPEADMSAAEMLMMFHFYFTGNPEGLIFDAVRQPMSTAIWQPFQQWLPAHGVTVRLETGVTGIENDGAGWRVRHGDGATSADLLVLALDVSSLRSLLEASPALDRLAARLGSVRPTWPFAVWRLWLDRRVAKQRAVFAGVTGLGLLDSIAVYDHFQEESIAWSQRHGGSVVELHAYAVPPERTVEEIRSELRHGLEQLYPEVRDAGVIDERFLLRRDCPAFPPATFRERPGTATEWPTLALAGDFVAMPFPSALMERAAMSGFLAANTLLAGYGIAPEPIHSVPQLGAIAARPRPAEPPRRTTMGNSSRGFQWRRAGSLWLAGERLPPATRIDPQPDWEQANPVWLKTALAHSQQLPGGGWYVLDASRRIGERPRRLVVCERELVVWRAEGALFAAPDRCPHLGAALSDGCVRDGQLICPWHGLALDERGHQGWRTLTTYDDGLLSWVQLDNEPPTPRPAAIRRPPLSVAEVVRLTAACDVQDVIANRLDPWHGAHFHPDSFATLAVIDRQRDEVTVRVAFRLLGRLAVEADARFFCVDPRHIVMNIVRGEGSGSVIETHVTPVAPGRVMITEAVLAASERTGFRLVRSLGGLIRPFLARAARRLWRDDAAYAERLYSLRQDGR